MTIKRQQRSSKFKFQIALEAAKGNKTINQLASEHNLNPGQVSQWKGQLMEKGATLFDTSKSQDEKGENKHEAELYEQIGRLKMDLEWLKKKSTPFS